MGCYVTVIPRNSLETVPTQSRHSLETGDRFLILERIAYTEVDAEAIKERGEIVVGGDGL